jgi:hypothetical protein
VTKDTKILSRASRPEFRVHRALVKSKNERNINYRERTLYSIFPISQSRFNGKKAMSCCAIWLQLSWAKLLAPRVWKFTSAITNFLISKLILPHTTLGHFKQSALKLWKLKVSKTKRWKVLKKVWIGISIQNSNLTYYIIDKVQSKLFWGGVTDAQDRKTLGYLFD